MDNIQDLLIQVLDERVTVLENRTPLIKKQIETIDISDVSPLDIVQFMKDNNIPDNSWFGGEDNGYDGYRNVCLCWEIHVPTTEKERLQFKRDTFSIVTFKSVHDLYLNNGYKRKSFGTHLLGQFKDTTCYDMYVNKDFDRLEKYYSLHFQKLV